MKSKLLQLFLYAANVVLWCAQNLEVFIFAVGNENGNLARCCTFTTDTDMTRRETDRRMDRRTDRRMDRRTDRQTGTNPELLI